MRTEKQQRMILRTYGHALSTITENQVPVGLISNRDGTRKVPLVLGANDFAIWLKQLLAARRATTPPPLFLNDHCQICEFQTHCRKRALDEGNLSLLKGMTPNEVAKYNAKGLFTVNQISYTFRARRKPKRARPKTGPHYFSLQAQALREKKIFVQGLVDFKINAPRLYFDIEGNPDNGIDYLIGALNVDKDKTEFVSFWRNGTIKDAVYFPTSCATSRRCRSITLFTLAVMRVPPLGGRNHFYHPNSVRR
jgi:predicted RecB family nuclease